MNRIKDIIIIGGGGHAMVLADVIRKTKDYNLLGYTDYEQTVNSNEIRYIGTDEEMMHLYPSENVYLALGIGMVKPQPERYLIFQNFLKKGYRFPAIISPNAVYNSVYSPGEGTVIFDGVVVNFNAEIGRAVILNTNATVEHDCKISDNVHIGPGAVLSGNVTIEKNSMVGVGATIIQGRKIGENILVGAGSVITKDIDKPGTYFGIPARKIGR